MKNHSFYLGLFAGLIIFATGIVFIVSIYSHPTALVRKIAEADSITVTNCIHEAFSIKVTGDEMKKVMQAISTANRGPLFVRAAASPFLRLEFYKGTNFLGGMDTNGKLFWVGQIEYLDQSGTLESLEAKYVSSRAATNSP